MPDDAGAQEAADLIARNWDAGTRIAALPETIRPRTRAEGYAVQAALMRTMRAPLFGWKIAATSLAGQRHIAVDGPIAGRIFAGKVLADGAVVPIAASNMRVAELELAFRMGRDLPPRAAPYEVAEAVDAAATLHPALEFPDSRFADFTRVGAAQLIADDACANLFLPGPATSAPWRSFDLAAHPVVGSLVRADGSRETHPGNGANVLGDPRIALAWIANELSALGVGLRAGEMVTTGTCVVPIAVAPGDELSADFGALGTLRVRFA